MTEITVHHGDCREVLASLPDCSVDSVVTDPPYELGFMGKTWDASGVAYSVQLWAEVLRVLKPGGHLCAFGGTRTYHRMAVAIEDAGFEIRDSLHWVYGSGFPKSLDVSKAIDKVNGEPDRLLKFTAWMRTTGLTSRQIDEITDTNMGGHYLTAKSQPAIPTAAMWQVLRPHCGEVPDWVDALVARIEAEREVIGKRTDGATRIYDMGEGPRLPPEVPITVPATDAAKQWEGWGTALKPAHEPIVVARKPLDGTVAANVLEHGTGALNIDGCRVDMGGEYDPTKVQQQQHSAGAIEGAFGAASLIGKEIPTYKPAGRWPANVIFDTEAGAVLHEQSGAVGSWSGNPARSDGSIAPGKIISLGERQSYGQTYEKRGGGASRFFTSIDWHPEVDVPFRYVAKPSKRERTCDGTVSGIHPTVKPLALMRWLVRLVTPPGGTVLEPFAGSGTTLMACVLEGFNGIGIEMTDEYLPIIDGRVQWAREEAQREAEAKASESEQESLF